MIRKIPYGYSLFETLIALSILALSSAPISQEVIFCLSNMNQSEIQTAKVYSHEI
jgi:hypothetical protein